MTFALMLFILLFIAIIQSTIPYLLKPTIVFGVTIPSVYTKDPTLTSYKRLYSLITAAVSVIAITVFTSCALLFKVAEVEVVFVAVSIQLSILLVSMVLYFVFHAKTSQLKLNNKWGADLKEVRITDLSIRVSDEMLPWSVYLVPIVITVGMIIYTVTQYENLPNLIPIHWGINGQPDVFKQKTSFTAIYLLLILLVTQGMMLGINELIKKSGIKLNVVKKKRSRAQQLSFRKYSSWFLFMTVLLMTILFIFLQFITIYSDVGTSVLSFSILIGFITVIFITTGIYAFKVGQGGSRLDFNVVDEEVEGITNYDDDKYWKIGIFYVNKNDPSIFVEKRFGVGWTLNFGHPIGYLVIFLPIILILIMSFLV